MGMLSESKPFESPELGPYGDEFFTQFITIAVPFTLTP